MLHAPEWLVFPWMKHTCWRLFLGAVWEIPSERKAFQAVKMLLGKENPTYSYWGTYSSRQFWRLECPKWTLRSIWCFGGWEKINSCLEQERQGGKPLTLALISEHSSLSYHISICLKVFAVSPGPKLLSWLGALHTLNLFLESLPCFCSANHHLYEQLCQGFLVLLRK